MGENTTESITIHTDGACSQEGTTGKGVGGYGAIVHYKEIELTIKGGALATTNNRMELQAVISGLESAISIVNSLNSYLPPIVVLTDSTYCLWCLNHNWRKTRLQKGQKKNADLLKELELLLLSSYGEHLHLITGKHVTGHSGDELNERCDKLAKDGILEIRNLSAESSQAYRLP